MVVGGPDTNFWHGALFEAVVREFSTPRSSVPLALDMRDDGSPPTYGSRSMTVRLGGARALFPHARGETVELEFRQPSPVSSTASLAVVSRHRLPLAVDGVLLMSVQLDDARVEALRMLDTPFTLIGRTRDLTGLDYVDIDVATSMRMAMDHLAELGHRHIAFINGSREEEGVIGFGPYVRSEAAYRELAGERGINPVVLYCRSDVASGREAARELLAAACSRLDGKLICLDVPRLDLDWLSSIEPLGFIEERPFLRMFLGNPAHPGTPEKQYAVTGPEFA